MFFSLVENPRAPFNLAPSGKTPEGVFIVQFPDSRMRAYVEELGADRCEVREGMSYSLIYLFDTGDVLGFKMHLSEFMKFQ